MSNDDVKAALVRLDSFVAALDMGPTLPLVEAEWREVSAAIRVVTVALRERMKPTKASHVIPPNPDDVTAYSASIGYPLDGVAWCDHYTVKGWVIGKTRERMKDWQSAVRIWKRNGWGENGIALTAGRKPAAGSPVTRQQFREV